VSAVRRIVVGVSGSPGSLQALRHAADLARAYNAPLVPVLAWIPPGGDLADRSHPSPYLRPIWRDAAGQRLRRVIAVPPAELAQVSHGLRGWAFRHRGLSPADVGLPATH
jgi:nucleotide-binding universal stress UspA family protein